MKIEYRATFVEKKSKKKNESCATNFRRLERLEFFAIFTFIFCISFLVYLICFFFRLLSIATLRG